MDRSSRRYRSSINKIGEHSKTSADNSDIAKVKKDKLLACLTCPLCQQLFNEATTISECLHTFCKKCIHDKIVEDNLGCCPVCNTNLGTAPLDKLRRDNNLQDISTKIFKQDGKKSKEVCPIQKNVVKASEIVQCKRKEKSLSSLVDNLPKIAYQNITTKRRSKLSSRKTTLLQGPTFSSKEPSKRIDESPNKKETSSKPSKRIDESSQQKIDKNKEDKGPLEITCDLNQLPNLIEDEDLSKSKSSAISDESIIETPLHKNKSHEHKAKGKACIEDTFSSESSKHKIKHNVDDEDAQMFARKVDLNKPPNLPIADNLSKSNGKEKMVVEHHEEESLRSMQSNLVKKVRRRRQTKVAISQPTNNQQESAPIDTVVKVTTRRPEGISTPVWFTLVAAKDQKGEASLPQISPNCLRIKDENLPISVVRKYIAKKLNLTNEYEVEIMLHGHPVIPSLRLRNLVDVWCQTAPSGAQEIQTSVGNSAKDFVLVLSYARKVASP